MKDKQIGVLTYHTLRYLHRDYHIQKEFYDVTSPADIKKIIWDRVKQHFVTDEDNQAFIKGAKLCDYNTIFEWVCKERGWMFDSKIFATQILKDVLIQLQSETDATINKELGGGTASGQAMEMTGVSTSIPEHE
jgi:hypothetical protein